MNILHRNTIYVICFVIGGLFFQLPISAQELFMSAPDTIKAGEEFQVIFTLKDCGLKSDETFKWVPDKSMEIVSGPTKSSNVSITIQNGKTTKTQEVLFYYIVKALESGEFKDGEYSIVKGYTPDRPSNIATENISNNKQAEPTISSIGARTNDPEQMKYSKKSKLVTAIKGWCYNTDTYKWVGKNNFIHYDKTLEKPNLYADVCYGLQICKFTYEGKNMFVLKWLGQSGIDKNPCYIIMDEEQYTQMRNINSNGILLSINYNEPYKPFQSENQEIRKMMEPDMHSFFGARAEGDVIRFNKGDYQRFNDVNGVLDFEVKSGDFVVRGYFEMTKSDWAALFSL